jgi:undecaprenyl-diphosphatase
LNAFQAVLLGLIQGLTEFIPVSSSGHLVIVQYFLNIKEEQLLFNVVVHLGTLIPIFIVYRHDILEILKFKKERRKETLYILLAIIPTGIIGILFEDFFESLFSNPYLTSLMLIVTGLILYITEMMDGGNKELEELKFWQPILVGIAQGGAIIPGISRSGSTIAASLFQGLNRETAARFSFLKSIPVIGGAGFLQFLNVLESGKTAIGADILIIGLLSAAISGYLAIKILLKVLKEKKLNYFSYYCWTAALVVVLLTYFKG